MPSTALTFVLLSGLIPAAWEETTSASSDNLPTAAVLHEPSMPVEGAGAEPQTIARILQNAGCEVKLLSASEFADPQTLNADNFDLAVLPSGRSFPARGPVQLHPVPACGR